MRRGPTPKLEFHSPHSSLFEAAESWEPFRYGSKVHQGTALIRVSSWVPTVDGRNPAPL